MNWIFFESEVLTPSSVLNKPLRCWLLLCAAGLATNMALATGLGLAAERVVWKPLENAVLRMDDRPARMWNVYRAEKKDHLLLVQLGRRFLLLDIREREVYELDPAKLDRKDKELGWHEADKPAKPLPTAEWLVRDVGRARRIRAKLTSEGRVIEVHVPHRPDLRSLY